LKREPKFETRRKHRCFICGRSRSYLRKFGVCRICFRTLAHRGQIPGLVKSSW
jgi:small subunit ribosomal protein S14